MTLLGGSSRHLSHSLLVVAILTSLLVTTVQTPVAAHAGDDCALFSPADVEENDWFGSSVGIDGDTAVITSWIAEETGGPLNAGAAYVYDRQPDGSWLEGQKLLPSNPGASFNFGFSADIEGDIIAIGAWHETVGAAAQAGAVYIFERPTPTGTWVETARLTASDADPADDLGYNLEVDAATSSVIVGAQQDDEGGSNAGAAYVFRKTNGVWAQEAKLLDPNANTNDRAGNDVAMFGDWAVVGHHLDDVGPNGNQTNAGGALLYKRTGTTWAAPIELDGSNPEPVKNRAGYGVDIDGDLLVMTSYHDFDDRRPQAWIFRENNGVWTEEQQIFPYPSVNSGDHPFAAGNNNDGTHFGRHVELDNGVIAIGSSYDSALDFERGATHYWTQDANGLWKESARIDPEGNAKYFHAGIAVGLSDTHVIVGAEKGNTNDDGIHEPFKTSPTEIFNSGLACIGEVADIVDGSHSPNPFYEVYASVSDATVPAEGAPGDSNQASVNVTLSKAAPSEVTVELSTADGSATLADSDYTQVTSQVVTFAAGETSKTVLVDITGDYNTEPNESFLVELANPTTGVLIDEGVGQVTITDDDPLLVSIADASVVEGDAGNTAVLVDVSLQFPTTVTVSADVATVDDTASAGTDYVAVAETVTFNPGDQTKQVSIDVIGDSLIEGDELFTLEVQTTSAGLNLLDDGVGDITITDDDANAVSISDTSVTEGNAGADATVTLDVTLAEPAATAVDVTVAPSDGTATLADGDYVASSQTVSFAIGESTQQVSFTVTGDNTPEADEVFNAVLSNPTGGVTIGDGSGDITILNDDSISVSIGDGSTVEGALAATTSVSIDVTLSSPATAPVSVTVDTADGTATTADSDYTAVTAQVVSFAIGEDTKTVTVDVLGDDTLESNEAFTLVASAPTGGLTIADGTGDIDIFDDDSVAVVVGDATIAEGADATTDTVTVDVTLTQPAVGQVDVTIASADGTATTADSDYVANSQVVTFLDTESAKTVTFTINGDDVAETDEVFFVQASNIVGTATIADGTGEVTITNDDSVTVSIADGSVLEGDAGTTPLLLDVTLSGAAAEPVTVEVATADGTATIADSDYTAVSGQLVTVGVGETTKQVSVAVTGDEQFEDNESFTVTLSNPSAGLSIADGSATATITNDESISVSVANASIAEGDAGTSTVSVDVTLSDPADGVMTVLIDTADISATAGVDYVAPGQQTVTFQVNESAKTVDFTINGDITVEPNETFSVIASAPTGGLVLGDDTGVVTITNDDSVTPLTVSIGDVTIDPEGTGVTTTANVTVSLSSPAEAPIALDVSTADVTAVAPDDYTAISNQNVAFAVGEQSKIVAIDIASDTLAEPIETFELQGSNLLGSNVSFAENVGTITIVDDDPIEVSIADVSVVETDVGAKNLLVTFSLNGPSFQTVVIDYTTVDGTATVADVDYVAKSGEVRFLPGVEVLTRGIQYIGDTDIEPDEFFTVELSNPINATIGQGTATVTILDDDNPPPVLTISDVSVAEGDTGDTPTATVDLTLDKPVEENVSFTLATQDVTATAGLDYVASSTTFTFLQGDQSGTASFSVTGDLIGELDETFEIVASAPIGEIDLSTAVGTVTIVDNDSGVVAGVEDVAIAEGDWNSNDEIVPTDVTVTVTLSNPATEAVSLDLIPSIEAGDTAEFTSANPDIPPPAAQTINFGIGDTSQTATFTINGDNIAEGDETFSILASNATGNLLIGDSVGLVTILDDDPVEVSVTGIAISEGNAGSKNAIVTFSLSKPSAVGVRVDYTTTDGTATLADNDYVERFGDVRFPPLATVRTRGFTIVADTVEEADEIFTVDLTNPVNAVIGTASADVTILDDDNTLNPLIVGNATTLEGDSGPTTVDVALTLASPAEDAFTVDVETATLNGNATPTTDYVVIGPAQTVAFAQGDQSQTVTVTINGDTSPEPNEVFALVASNSTAPGVDFAQNTGTITIENDDLIDVSVGDVTVTEGGAATTVNAVVPVSLSQPAIGTMTVEVSTLDGSATALDSDYVASTQTLTFADGEQTKDVTLTVNGDDDFETNESFSLVVGTVTGDLNVLDGAGEITITDDDTAAGVSVVIGGVTVDEVDSGSTVDAIIDVQLSEPATAAVSLDIASADGTATLADGDYVAFSETVSFAIGEQTKQITVEVNGDDLAEADEIFTVVGSNPLGGLTILDDTGEITILDNDTAVDVDLTVADVSVVEGETGTATATVTLSLSGAPVFPVSVVVSTVDGTATVADNDYTAISGQTVSFGAGEQTKTVDVTIVSDTDAEPDEIFSLVASNPIGSINIIDNVGDITILTDDIVRISVGDVTVTEIDAGFKWAQVPFTLSAAPATAADAVTVNFTSVDGTATVADGDYETRAQELRFGAGVSTLTRGFKVFGDIDPEANELFTVELSGPVNAIIEDGIGEVTILDDDTAVIGLTVGDFSIAEGDAGTSTATVTVTLDSPAVNQLTVDVATADDTATAGSDYVAKSETLTFAPNEQSKTVDITINGDTAVETDETFNLVASNPSVGLALIDDTGQVTILHDDQPRLSISDTSVTEGDVGTATATVLVDLDRPPTAEMTVVISTIDGSATVADSDYTAVGQTLTFAIGEQSKAVNVFVNGDTTFETDEQLSVVATNPSEGLVIDDGTGVITINDDDSTGGLELIVGDASAVEGADGTTTTATVDVSLSFPSPGGVTVDVVSVDGTATTADSDYDALPVTSLTFANGEQTKQLQITVNGDDTDEPNETFTVVASNPGGGVTISDNTGVVSILNDDIPPGLQVSVGDTSVVEGASGPVIASVAVTLNQPAPVPVTVEVNTVDDTATTADSDYVAVTAQTVTFAANEQNATVDITVNGDTNQELNESFNLVASNPSAGLALGDDTGVITITTDDGVTISAGDVTMTEIDNGFRWAQMTFTLSAAPGSDTFIVQYATQDGTATVADGDYEAKTGELRFANSRTTLTRGFKVFGDQTPEADELFSVILSNPVNGSIADGTGEVTVLDDDNTGLNLTVGDVSVVEGNTGTTTASVPVSLDIPALTPLTFDVATADGTATTGDSDYTAISTQQVTFAVGEQNKTVDIDITGDTNIESTETLSLIASNPSAGLIIADNTGEITVTNDDFPIGTVALTVGDAIITEGPPGTSVVSVDVTLDSAPTLEVTAVVNTVDGTATVADGDYDAVTAQTVTFAIGETAKTVDITINGDATAEVNETFDLVASSPSVGMVLADDTGTVTIETDDAVTISAGDVTLTEIDSGYRWAQMTFTLSAAPGGDTFIAQYTTVDGTATLANGDYEARSGELKFVNNTTTLTRGFKVFGDTNPELDEMFSVVLSSPVNGVIADGVGDIFILDDDNTGVGLTVGDTTIVEGDAGTSTAVVDLTLASAAVVPMTVDVSTADGTATTADSDYTPIAAQQVSFAIGDLTKQVSIDITGDTNIEADEAFTLVASNPSTGLVLTDDTGEITVTNDDDPPVIDVSVADVTVAEGDVGETSAATVTVTLSQNAVIPVSVDLSTVDGTATAAAGSDFTAITNQTVQFAAGESSKTVDIDILGDDDYEFDEVFQVVTSNESASLNVVDGSADITITNDDALPTLSVLVGDASVVEGDAGSTNVVVDVNLSAPAVTTVTVDVATTDGTATTADGDYVANNETLSFAAGESSKQVTIVVNGDTALEGDEIFTLDATNPSVGLAILDGSGEVTITDDEVLTVDVGDQSIVEGDSPNTSVASVVLTLSEPAVNQVTVLVDTVDGTATTADGDYVAIASQTVTFPIGSSSQTVDITINGDDNIEADEAFSLVASGPSAGLSLGDATGAVTIQTDDQPAVSISDVTVTELNAGYKWAQVKFSLSAPSTQTVQIEYSTVPGTATAVGGDYTTRTQVLSFAPGKTELFRGIQILGDTEVEGDEFLTVELINPPVNAIVADGVGQITIEDNDD